MQKDVQLSLFGPPVGRISQRRTKKRLNPHHANTLRWDLWTQESNSEQFMALFFLDIRDFSPLTQREHARDVINIITKLFSTFRTLIRIHHGRIIETTGDGFYAAFGFDRNPSQAVNDAVSAGYSILNTLERLNDETLASRLGRRIQVGIGIHAGEVATGEIDLNGSNHLLVMGHAVTVASRIQSVTRVVNNDFLISASAFRRLPTQNDQLTPITTNLKGITDPVDVYAIGQKYF